MSPKSSFYRSIMRVMRHRNWFPAILLTLSIVIMVIVGIWLFRWLDYTSEMEANRLRNHLDNGAGRKWSRVVEVDPLAREIVWQYGAEADQRFFSGGRGSCQRLENGNTLIAHSNLGEAFEVTPDGRKVWQFWNPEVNEEGRRDVIVRMIRYPDAMVRPLLAR